MKRQPKRPVPVIHRLRRGDTYFYTTQVPVTSFSPASFSPTAATVNTVECLFSGGPLDRQVWVRKAAPFEIDVEGAVYRRQRFVYGRKKRKSAYYRTFENGEERKS